MKTIEIPATCLRSAPWNANQMDEVMLSRLKLSLALYGAVVPLVVRPLLEGEYEVLSGNQRLRAMKETGLGNIPCVIVNLADNEAMLLAQALNGIHGEDDVVSKAALFKKIKKTVPMSRILSLLPETTESLSALSQVGTADLARQLQIWEQTRSVRLRHMQLQLTGEQMVVVEKAVSHILTNSKDDSSANPNRRGNAIYQLCREYLEKE